MTQAGTSAGASGIVQITILSRSKLQVAPEGVFLRASVRDPGLSEATSRSDYDPSFHDCTYVWDFGDRHAHTDKVSNVAAAHGDLNRAYGKEVGHVYTQPGRYVVTCTVHGPEGPVGVGRIELELRDPDAAFPEGQTILLDPRGQEDARFPEAQIAPSLAEARALLETLEAPGRILMRRGSVLDYGETFWVGAEFENLYIATYGDGPRPVIRSGPTEHGFLSSGGNFTGDMVLQGLDLRGPWDSETETGHLQPGLGLVNAALWADSTPNPRYALVEDCLLSGFSLGIYLPQHRPPGAIHGTHIHNTAITGCAGYAVFAGDLGDGAVSITGSALTHAERAPSGGSGDWNRGNSMGPMRTGGGGRIYCAVSDFFSRCGWTRIDEIPADQPCLRWNTTMTPGASAHFERCAFEGGISVVTSVFASDGQPPRAAGNFVMEKCLIVGTAVTYNLIEWESNGATFRNNLLIRPASAIPFPHATWNSALNMYDPTERQLADPQAPVLFYSNTYVNLMDASTHAGSPLALENGRLELFEVFSNENNIVHTPRLPALQPEDPQLQRAELATMGGVWRSRYRGLRYDDRPMMEAYATPPGSVWLYVPAPGAPTRDSASGRVAFDDFLGRVRGDRPDRGAMEAP